MFLTFVNSSTAFLLTKLEAGCHLPSCIPPPPLSHHTQSILPPEVHPSAPSVPSSPALLYFSTHYLSPDTGRVLHLWPLSGTLTRPCLHSAQSRGVLLSHLSSSSQNHHCSRPSHLLEGSGSSGPLPMALPPSLALTLPTLLSLNSCCSSGLGLPHPIPALSLLPTLLCPGAFHADPSPSLVMLPSFETVSSLGART